MFNGKKTDIQWPEKNNFQFLKLEDMRKMQIKSIEWSMDKGYVQRMVLTNWNGDKSPILGYEYEKFDFIHDF